MRSGVTFAAASNLSQASASSSDVKRLGMPWLSENSSTRAAVDIDGADQFDALDLAELRGMLLRHPAGAEYQKTHYVPFQALDTERGPIGVFAGRHAIERGARANDPQTVALICRGGGTVAVSGGSWLSTRSKPYPARFNPPWALIRNAATSPAGIGLAM